MICSSCGNQAQVPFKPRMDRPVYCSDCFRTVQARLRSRARRMACHTAPMTQRQRWTLIATIIGSGAVFLDGTIVNAALKHIGQELPASLIGVLEGQAYIVSGYLATLAALLILAGGLSDHYGRRRVFAIGLVGFAGTSALCGLAPTLEWLVVFRLLQGAAGALLSRVRCRSSPTPSTARRGPAHSASGRRRPPR